MPACSRCSACTSAPVWVADRLAGADAEIVRERDPCILPKATKTAAEIAGSRTAHLRDAAAVAICQTCPVNS